MRMQVVRGRVTVAPSAMPVSHDAIPEPCHPGQAHYPVPLCVAVPRFRDPADRGTMRGSRPS